MPVFEPVRRVRITEEAQLVQLVPPDIGVQQLLKNTLVGIGENPAEERQETIVAPVGGLSDREFAVGPQNAPNALVLSNFWPTERGLEVRKGYVNAGYSGNVGDPVTAVVPYSNGAKTELFLLHASGSLQRVPVDVTGGVGVATGLPNHFTNPDISYALVRNAGGVVLILVNGVDSLLYYDGVTLERVPSLEYEDVLGNTHQLDTRNLSHVWLYGNRVFYVQKNSTDAWYHGIGETRGRVSLFPLSGVFDQGGGLLSGFPWAVDAGNNLVNRCVFVSDCGEYAVYNGDPAVDFALDGVYTTGILRDKTSYYAIGGDVRLMVENGVKSFVAVVQTESGVETRAIDANVLPIMRRAFGDTPTQKFEATYHRELDMGVYASLGPEPRIFVYNERTRAWATIDGWDTRSIVSVNGHLFMGLGDGSLARAWEGGMDGDSDYTAIARLPHHPLGSIAHKKTVTGLQGVWISGTEICPGYRPVVSAATPLIGEDDLGVCGVDELAGCNWDACTWDSDFWGAVHTLQHDTVRQEWCPFGSRSNAHLFDIGIKLGTEVHPEPVFFALNVSYIAEPVVS